MARRLDDRVMGVVDGRAPNDRVDREAPFACRLDSSYAFAVLLVFKIGGAFKINLGIPNSS